MGMMDIFYVLIMYNCVLLISALTFKGLGGVIKVSVFKTRQSWRNLKSMNFL